MKPPPGRVIALGASNLARGLPVVVAASRSAFGPEVEVFAALGLGRSYGMDSRVLARTLPAILECGLWSALASRAPSPTRALVTDVGNDILFGASPKVILEWVEEALRRLAALTDDVVVAGLPMASIRKLTAAKYLAFRTITYPRCRLPFRRVADDAERIDEGLQRLAAAYSARHVALRSDWYGFDPIHIRPARWATAWQEILGEPCPVPPSWLESVRLLALPPERRRLFGFERVRAQPGTRLPAGGVIRLF